MAAILRMQRQKAGQGQTRSTSNPSTSAAAKLLMKETAQLIHDLPTTSQGQMKVQLINDDIFKLALEVNPTNGLWREGRFNFVIDLPHDYPFQRPKVKCMTKIYHPNIDADGNVCLNILREDFNPTVHIEQICEGILFLFLNANPDSPLNDVAAQEMINNPSAFEENVRRSVLGGLVKGVQYPGCHQSQ